MRGCFFATASSSAGESCDRVTRTFYQGVDKSSGAEFWNEHLSCLQRIPKRALFRCAGGRNRPNVASIAKYFRSLVRAELIRREAESYP
jgi:hypothetical protein